MQAFPQRASFLAEAHYDVRIKRKATTKNRESCLCFARYMMPPFCGRRPRLPANVLETPKKPSLRHGFVQAILAVLRHSATPIYPQLAKNSQLFALCFPRVRFCHTTSPIPRTGCLALYERRCHMTFEVSQILRQFAFRVPCLLAYRRRSLLQLFQNPFHNFTVTLFLTWDVDGVYAVLVQEHE